MTPVEWLLQKITVTEIDNGDIILFSKLNKEQIEQAKQMEAKQRGYIEEQVREAISMTRDGVLGADEIIQSLKQNK